MPIRPENKHRYPKDWPEIRAQILERAGHCCEECGLRNHIYGYRDEHGDFHQVSRLQAIGPNRKFKPGHLRIVLTIAHLDHTPENCDPGNLRALCQRCHNRYDAKTRSLGKAQRRRLAMNVHELSLDFMPPEF